jgi:predicted small lipoprotein YifL
VGRRRVLAAAILLAATAAGALCGCGQKSALYLPQKKKVKVPADATNPEGSAPEIPSSAPDAPATAPNTAPVPDAAAVAPPPAA